MSQKIFYLLLLILLIVLPVSAQVEIGGEIKANLISTIYQGEIKSLLQETLQLELLIPRFGDTDAKVELKIYNPELLNGERISFQKLYLKRKFDQFYLTVGRQPISWSFGSMLNPVDYSLGAEAIKQETIGKYQDAVALYVPLNWNSNLALVASNFSGTGRIKWGIRGRAGYKGYDLTASLIREPAINLTELNGLLNHATDQAAGGVLTCTRAGLTAKGDLGPLGVYSALGYYHWDQREQGNLVLLLGGDYSYTYHYDQLITAQLEYLILEKGELLSGVIPAGEHLNFLIGNINYPLDDFSALNFSVISSLDDGSMVLQPSYQVDLGSNLSLNLSGFYQLGDPDKILASADEKRIGGMETTLSYSF